MKSPLVSICIPTYERTSLLRATIESCLRQTHTDFEIIVTDNSRSTDSEDMLNQLGDGRIRYYRNPDNLGPYRNMDKALSMGQGRYLKLLMDDDLLTPDSLERMVEIMETHPTVGVVMAPMELIDAEGKRIFPKFYLFRTMHHRYRFQAGDGLIEKKRLVREFLTRDYPCCVPSGILYRAECFKTLGPMDFQAEFAVDLEIVNRFATRYDFYYIDRVLSGWRHLPTNYTGSLHEKGMNIGVFYYITKKMLSLQSVQEMFPEKNEWRKLVRDAFFFCSCRALLNLPASLRSRRVGMMAQTFQTILRNDPFPWNWLRLPLFIIREIWVSWFPKKLGPIA